jgi:hypothetical protein
VTYKATATGWVVVPLLWTIEFTGGSAAYTEGSAVTKGAASATVRRVVLESGSWSAGTAAGQLVVNAPTGTFTAGLAGGGGVANLTGGATQITQFAGGRVRHDVYNFTASVATRRLYCCDGVNVEWEFDGEVVAPIRTGMGGIRATAVKCHKNHLFLAYRSSLQHSALGLPYQWTPVLGAAELSAGDTITNLRGVSGSESNAALMALCADSAWVLYGSSISDWQFNKISDEAGAQRDSAQEIGGVVGFDMAGARIFKPTQSFGNFSYELATDNVEPLALGQIVKDSVLVKSKSLFRVFFSDGLFLSGVPAGNSMDWMACDYGRVIECCVGGEINGEYRIFMGDPNGWVLEADVGRSFDGDEIDAAMRLSRIDSGNRLTEKRYRHIELDMVSDSACELAVGAEFSEVDSDPSEAAQQPTGTIDRMPGAGLFWDINQWDRSYWDAGQTSWLRFPVRGKGRFISILIQSLSDKELSHEISGAMLSHIQGRLAR